MTDNEDAGPSVADKDWIRIRPNDFSAPTNDPFENDLLDRKPAIEALTKILGSGQSPYVISVDADWGYGKTAFLNMWCQHLRNEKYTVVQFNAWETDFANNPFQALSAEITRRLEDHSDSGVKTRLNAVKESAASVAVAFSKSALTGVGAMLPGFGQILAGATINGFEALSEEPISDYLETKDSLDEFRKSIADMSAAVSRHSNRKPLVVAIDELDRCRPTYAVELIEAAKHIFSVENVVFILAINSGALAHSVKSLYGDEFDAERYFRRFFDLQFRLPVPDRQLFATELLKSTKLQESIGSQREGVHPTFALANALLSSRSMSLRDAEQSAYRLGLILAMLDDVKPWMPFCALIGLSIMVFQPDSYVKFLRGEIEDQDLLQILANNLPLQNELSGIKPWIEGAVIALAQSRSMDWKYDFSHLSSELINIHRQNADSNDSAHGRPTQKQQYSAAVLQHAREYWDFVHMRAGGSSLIDAMRCLELLVPVRSDDSRVV